MPTISPVSNSPAAVALRLLTEAATRAPGIGSALPDAKGMTPPGLSPPSGGVRISLSLEAAEQAYGADSFLMQQVRGRADRVEVSLSTIPEDKDALRSEVIAFLGKNRENDAEFMAALKAGEIVVHTVDEVPDLNIQPMVSFTMYRDGAIQGSGGFTPSGFNQALYEQLSATRGQATGSLGHHQFYAYWPRLT